MKLEAVRHQQELIEGKPVDLSSITPNSLKSWPEGSVAVVAHDAGAARHLFSWLAH